MLEHEHIQLKAIAMINLKQSELFDFAGQSVISPFDRLKKFIFSSYPVIEVDSLSDDEELLKLAAKYVGTSEMVWVKRSSAVIREDFPWHFRPTGVGKKIIHMFPKVTKRTGRPTGWGDLKLVPTDMVAHGVVENKIICSYNEADFDVFMISYHEEEADSNFAKLKQKFPDAQHVKNVKGIAEAHKECARRSETEMVYIVDADSEVLSSFNFDYFPPMAKRKNTTYVWYARNPINDLEYGYGGIKLFPREQLLEMGHVLPDFSAGVAFYQPVKDVASITMFNKDPFRTWRSAFRECVKLASGIQQSETPKQETIDRLETWCTVDNGARFGRYCIKGANEGKAYGEAHADDVDALNKINDFEWLREQFVESMKNNIRI